MSPLKHLSVATVALLATLSGCSSVPTEESAPVAPVRQVPPAAWRAVDERIWAVSRAARDQAEGYARGAMREWVQEVRERTEEEFVPWYSGYWTQQWLAIKLGFIEMSEREGHGTAEEQLAEYIQDQYYERVLEPIGRKSDPYQIAKRATSRYLELLDADLRPVPGRYGVPPAAFYRRLDKIPAIALRTAPAYHASLHQVIEADGLESLPAFGALMARIEPAEEGVNPGLSKSRFYPAARIGTDKLAEKLAIRGGATAAALAMGGVAGILISVGVSGWQAIEHEKDRPALEAQLRENLDTALDGMWRYLMEDPFGGVMAAVNHMHLNVENGLLSVELQGGE